MILYSSLILLGIVADAWLLTLVALRIRRFWTKATFAALALSFIIMGGSYVGTAEGFLPASWEGVTLGALVLAHPLTAILVLSLIHGEVLPRRRPLIFLLLVPVPFLAALAPVGGWSLNVVYAANPLGGFLVLSMAIALAETIYARITSPLMAAESFWLSAGLVALLVAGPIYGYELQALSFPDSAGSNVATPIALGAFALVAFHGNPFPAAYPVARRRWRGEGALGDGLTFVFDETRPKYAGVIARSEAGRGRPVLILSRTSSAGTRTGGRPLEAALEPTRYAALRTLGTASEFVTRAPGSLVAIPELADLSAIAGWARTRDMLLRMRVLCRLAGSSLLLTTSRLTEAEREDLRGLKMPWWPLPDPADEIEAILARSFGTGAGRLLESFERAQHLARGQLTTAHVEALTAFLEQAVGELAVGAGDAKAVQGLRDQVSLASQALRAYAARNPADLSRGDWPSKESGPADREFLVRAADYWKGKEMEELFTTAQALSSRESLYDRAKAVFTEHLGDAGESLLRTELTKLGRTPADLGPGDLSRLADRAAVDLAVMADVVDVPQERDRIAAAVESIRRRLATLGGDDL